MLQIGPVFLPPRLTGQAYLEFLRDTLPPLLEDVPLADRQRMLYQHDGAPAHFSRNVRELLDRMFPDRWIGRNGPVWWPARSPDLTPLDYFLWGCIKEIVYKTPPRDQDDCRQRIIDAFNEVRERGMVQNAVHNIVRRATLVTEHGGGHIENYL